MKYQFSLFYAVCVAVGVASQELLEIDAEDRIMKGGGGKGGGGKGGGGKGGGGKGGGGKGGDKGGKAGSGGKSGKTGGGDKGGKAGSGGKSGKTGGGDKGGKAGSGGKSGKTGGGDKGGKAGSGGKSGKTKGGDKGGKAGSGGKSGKTGGGDKGGKAGRMEEVKSAKSSYAKTYYSKSAKATAAPTSSLAPTMLATEPKGKSKGVDLSWCPFGSSKGKSKGKSQGKRRMLKGKSSKGDVSYDSSGSSDADLSNALGQEPGSSLLIQPSDDPSLCVQPTELVSGEGLEAVTCTYDDADVFRVDRYGRLHSSQWSLCVTGVDGALVLGSCDTCDAVFAYDFTTMMISPYGDDSVVFTLKNGKMSLQEPVVARKGKFFFTIFQIFIIIVFTGVPPTTSPAPTGSLVPL
eukprot:CAMPEP_0194297842 /NCGR_PEP_ID=MMETSP0169-20130528/59832_1 /TAXON_ID=218684 /ORGANISM="Corethron pennatum, Strain L29A3" /LENGTH=404 /DNA_ID=CAMNT_0039047765 /DNA_START=176 /DNA_END=1390 /DNA_ORIENTATION=-